MNAPAKPKYFATPGQWRAWLDKNHAKKDELWVGFHKKDTGKPSITWPQSVDEALCYGWIDGIRKSLGPESYMIRFTQRRPGSVWSAVNTRRVAAEGVQEHHGHAAHPAVVHEDRSGRSLDRAVLDGGGLGRAQELRAARQRGGEEENASHVA